MIDKRNNYVIGRVRRNRRVIKRMMRPWNFMFVNYFKLKRYWDFNKYYSFGSKVDIKKKDEDFFVNNNIMTKDMMKHPIIFEIDPFFKTIKLANISHQYKEIDGIDVKYIGLRKDGKETWLYGPYERKFNTYKEWNMFLELVKKSKEFDYEKELLPETYKILLNKCKMNEIDNDFEEEVLRAIEFDFWYNEKVLKINTDINLLKKED